MFDLKTLLLPVDLSERSLEAARQAKGIARHFHFRLVVLNVLESRAGNLRFEPGGFAAQEFQSYLDREFRETPVAYDARAGKPAQIIGECAREEKADLIVMAGRNRGPFESFAVGSVTADVLCSALAPVWVSSHPERGPAPRFRRILCAAGLSDSTLVPLDWALRFAGACDAACDVIHVPANSHAEEQARITEDALTSAERERLETAKRKLDGRGHVILAGGDLAAAIIAASTHPKTDLLVMGRSRPGNEIAHVRSLPFTLAHRASCPVVVV